MNDMTHDSINMKTLDGAVELAKRLSAEGRSEDSRKVDLLLDLCDRLRIERDRARSAYENLHGSMKR